MILRIWTTRVNPAREDEYLAYARVHSRAMFLAQDGCLGVLFLRRADGRHAACSIWRDAAAVDALACSVAYQHTAAGLAATRALMGEPEIELFALTGGAIAPELGRALAATEETSPPSGR